MKNQISILPLAPRAGFEPATNRLTAGGCSVGSHQVISRLRADEPSECPRAALARARSCHSGWSTASSMVSTLDCPASVLRWRQPERDRHVTAREKRPPPAPSVRRGDGHPQESLNRGSTPDGQWSDRVTMGIRARTTFRAEIIFGAVTAMTQGKPSSVLMARFSGRWVSRDSS